MTEVTITSFTPSTTIKSSEVNTNFSNLATQGGKEHSAAGKHGIIEPTATKQNLVTVADAATMTLDLDTGNMFVTAPLGGNRILAVSNVDVGQAFYLRILQDGTGSRTVTWFSSIAWANGGTEPTLTTTLSRADAFGFICTSAGQYDGYIIGQDIV